MGLLKNVRRECDGLGLAMVCILMAVTILLAGAETAGASGAPKTVAEIALYQGPDREKILIEGAKKEGQLIFYDSYTGFRAVAQEFEKKYPFIKVSEWRSASKELYKRVMEEYAARRFLVDVIATTDLMSFLLREGVTQEYYSPHTLYFEEEYKSKGKTGVYYTAVLEHYISLGFNTERVPRAEAPKTLKDLLDPKWKGKMSVTSSSTTIRWLGNALEAMGHEFIEKLSFQDIKVQNISGAAMAGLVASGEVPLSPTIFNDNVFVAKKKGAPIEWRALEPVVTFVHNAGMTTKSPHPHTALLFLDYLHSREGQQVVMRTGPNSPRKDMASPETKFKRTIWESKYSPEEFEKKFTLWENLLRTLIVKGK